MNSFQSDHYIRLFIVIVWWKYIIHMTGTDFFLNHNCQVVLSCTKYNWTGSNPSRRESRVCGFTISRSHSCCAVRLVYTQISPGHIWTTLYFTNDYIINLSNLYVWRYFDEARLTAAVPVFAWSEVMVEECHYYIHTSNTRKHNVSIFSYGLTAELPRWYNPICPKVCKNWMIMAVTSY
jgi:hypothetical protein